MDWKLRTDLLHGIEIVSWPGLAFHKNPSCYNNFLVLNFIMLSAQYDVILYSKYFLVLFAVTLFCCSSHVPLFRSIPIFCQYSVVCSAGVPCSVVLCSGVPGFIVSLFQSVHATWANWKENWHNNNLECLLTERLHKTNFGIEVTLNILKILKDFKIFFANFKGSFYWNLNEF